MDSRMVDIRVAQLLDAKLHIAKLALIKQAKITATAHGDYPANWQCHLCKDAADVLGDMTEDTEYDYGT